MADPVLWLRRSLVQYQNQYIQQQLYGLWGHSLLRAGHSRLSGVGAQHAFMNGIIIEEDAA